MRVERVALATVVSLCAACGSGGSGSSGGAPAATVTEVEPTAILSRSQAPLTVRGAGLAGAELRLGGLPFNGVTTSDAMISGQAPIAPAGSDLSLTSPQGQVFLGDALEVFSEFEAFSNVSGLAGTPLARSSATATTLSDGRVLIAGGLIAGGSGDVSTASCILFDPATGSLLPTGPLAQPRASHLAVRLDDGRVAVIGGDDKQPSQTIARTTIEVFDPSSGQWTTSLTGAAPRAISHAASRLPNGDWLVLGGFTATNLLSVQGALEVFDPSFTSASTSAATLTQAGPFVTLGSGEVVGFGSTGSFASASTVELVTLMPGALSAPSGTDLVAAVTSLSGLGFATFTPSVSRFPSDDRILVFDRSGATALIAALSVDLSGPSLTVLGQPNLDPSRARSFAGIHPSADGALFIGPGSGSSGALGLGDLYVPDLGGPAGGFLPLVLEERRSYASVSLRDGRVALIGGRTGGLSGPLRADIAVVSAEALAAASLAGARPVILGASPASGTQLNPGERELRLIASAPLNPGSLQDTDILYRLNGQPQAALSLRLEGERRIVVRLPATLPAGAVLELEVRDALISDSFGRRIDASRGAPRVRVTAP